jgi:hypothetical protein
MAHSGADFAHEQSKVIERNRLMASFAIIAMDKEHADAVSSSPRVLGIFTTGAPPRAIAVSGKAPTPEPQLTPPSGEGHSWGFSLPVCRH